MTVIITQQTRRLTAPPVPSQTTSTDLRRTIRKITQTNKRTYACHLSKDQVADLLRGDMGDYHPEPTQQEWDDWCDSVSEAHAGGFR